MATPTPPVPNLPSKSPGQPSLCRYFLRPPLAVKRLERLPDGRVRLGMERLWSAGTAAVEFSAQEITERLAALVPPPRANQVLYGAVLAGNAAWRAEVVPKVATSDEARLTAHAELRLVRRAAKRARKAGDEAPCWAELLKRVFGVDGWKWSSATPARCEKRMTLRTIVVRAPASTRVVTGLLRARGPPGVARRVSRRRVRAGWRSGRPRAGPVGGSVPRRAQQRRAGEKTSKIRRAEPLRCGRERGYAPRGHSARDRSWFLSSNFFDHITTYTTPGREGGDRTYTSDACSPSDSEGNTDATKLEDCRPGEDDDPCEGYS